MTHLQVIWEPDEEDEVTRSAESVRFFAAWVNQFGMIEWTCTDPYAFRDMVELIDS